MKLKINFSQKSAKIISLLLITSILMTVFSTSVYGTIAKPEFYKQFINLGNKYLSEGNYQEAILEFNKAIKIEPKSTDARVGAAKGYIGINDVPSAEKLLQEAQLLAPLDENLLLEIIDILKDVDPQMAYEMLKIYVGFIGENNISSKIKALFASSKEDPVKPILNPAPNTYVQPISVKFQSDKTRMGHVYYYTKDGKVPNKNSILYRSPVEIKEGTVTLNIIGYNPDGKATEQITAQYTIDPQPKQQINSLLDEAKKVYDNTSEGNNVGNCVTGAKSELLAAINKGRDLFSSAVVSSIQAKDMYAYLKKALDNFKFKIIEPCDKTALKNTIDQAKKLVSSSVEGTQDGQISPGSKEVLNKQIANAETISNDILTRQSTADSAVENLKAAMKTFENSRVRLVVNPDGTNFTYGFKTLMGNETSKTFTGRFTVITSGTANLAYGNKKNISNGDTGSITINLSRTANSVTVSATERWDKDNSTVYTLGRWYAEYSGADNTFKLYPDVSSYTDKFEGTYIDGKMNGGMYLSGVGHYMNFYAQ